MCTYSGPVSSPSRGGWWRNLISPTTSRTASPRLGAWVRTETGGRPAENEDQVAAAVERAVATFGRLDMAFNNAGIMIPPSDAADEPVDNFDRVNAINVRGV